MYLEHIQPGMNPEEVPIVPIEITGEDKTFLEEYIGAKSTRHGEYYVRAMYGGEVGEREVWYLTYYSLGKGEVEAVKDLREGYLLSADEATAAWMFINRYPRTAAELLAAHNDSVEYMSRVKQTADPHEELSLKP